jgi:hypothetical protein
MPDRPSDRDAPGRVVPTTAPGHAAAAQAKSDAFLCDRCRAEMFRMHAVWRCPACGYKTDCCGW